MPTSTYSIAPANTGDAEVVATTAGTFATNQSTGRIGRMTGGKITVDYNVYTVFSGPALTANALVKGVKVTFKGSANGTASSFFPMELRGGFLKEDGYWDTSTSMAAYGGSKTNLPIAQANSGAVNDLTVFYNDNYGFSVSFPTLTNTSSGAEWSFGAGTLSGTNGTFADLLDQARDHVAAVADGSSAVKFGFHIYKQWIASVGYQRVHLSEATSESNRPQFTIEYSEPPTLAITSPSSGLETEPGSITFSATSTDLDDGNIASSVAWSSSLDGSFATGASVAYSGLSGGSHVITATSTNSSGLVSTATVSIVVFLSGHVAGELDLSPSTTARTLVSEGVTCEADSVSVISRPLLTSSTSAKAEAKPSARSRASV